MDNDKVESLVRWMVRGYRFPRHEMDEILQEARIAAWMADVDYDDSRGVSLAGYQYKRIWWAVNNCRKRMWGHRRPLSMPDSMDIYESNPESPGRRMSDSLERSIVENMTGRNNRPLLVIDILRMLVDGYTQVEIARKMHRSRQFVGQIIHTHKDAIRAALV